MYGEIGQNTYMYVMQLYEREKKKFFRLCMMIFKDKKYELFSIWDLSPVVIFQVHVFSYFVDIHAHTLAFILLFCDLNYRIILKNMLKFLFFRFSTFLMKCVYRLKKMIGRKRFMAIHVYFAFLHYCIKNIESFLIWFLKYWIIFFNIRAHFIWPTKLTVSTIEK